MNEDIAIKVDGLTKVYPIYNNKNDRMREALSLSRKKYHTDFHALNNVTFEIQKGETVGIIGQNGSGKSTLLKILTGVLTQTSGNVEVNGKVSALLELGAGFNPEMTGIENIYLNGTIMGYSKAEMSQRVPKIIQFADIGEFVNQPVKMYSSGMFARLAFAVAINVEPEILIIDEALSVGDLFFQNKCFHKLSELRESDITILFVSHDLASIKQMCNKVLWLDKGIGKSFGEKNRVCAGYHSEQLAKNKELFTQVENTKTMEVEYDSLKKVFPKIHLREGDMFSDEIEIKSFFICDEEGNITTTLQTEKNFSIHIVSENKRTIENTIFGITLENNKGISIAAFNSYANNDGKNITVEINTITEVILQFCLPKLQKGEYLLSVAIAEGTQENHRNIIWLYNNMSIVVENEGYNMSFYEFNVNFEATKIKKENATFV